MQPQQPPTPADQPPEGKYPFGWRFVTRSLPEGGTEVEQVPLTLEDVLHPQEGDVIPQRSLHEMECAYLTGVFRSRPPALPVVRVTADLLIDWGVPSLREHSPDVAVFVGLKEEPNLDEGIFHLGPSGGRCLLVVEVVSPHTRVNDVVHKVREYHQAGVPLYVLVDQEREDGPRRLVAYRHTAAGYQEVGLDPSGNLSLPAFGLRLGLREGRLMCFDASSGRELGDYAQVSRELDAADRRIQEQEKAIEESVLLTRAQARALDEAERLAREQRQAREEAERLARERKEALDEARRRETEQKQALDEARRRETEQKQALDEAARQAREQADVQQAAADRIRELEAALLRLQGGSPP